jgi:hypothetical protein
MPLTADQIVQVRQETATSRPLMIVPAAMLERCHRACSRVRASPGDAGIRLQAEGGTASTLKNPISIMTLMLSLKYLL